MVSVLGTPRRGPHGVTRRQVLQAGGLALAGLSLPAVLAAEARRTRPARAKSVILLYLLGGAATQDMVDLKPDAPDGIRGEFKPIATSAPGVQVCDQLPRMAQWMHKVAVVRSLNHRGGCHNPLPSYTGYEVMPPDIVSTRDTYPPSMGSVCEYLRTEERDLPDYVYMPCYLGWGQSIRRPGPYAGFLGQRYDPLCTDVVPLQDPGTPAERPGHPQVLRGVPQLPHSVLGDGLSVDRLNSRHGLLDQVDAQVRALETQRSLDSFTRSQQRAFSLLTSSQARAAFDLSREDVRVRERYGRSLFGNCTLIARRLVEAGVRFVNVTWDIFWERLRLNYDGWDTHTRNFPILRDYNLPYFERAFTALLQDLDDRGLLDETLIAVMSEMGRTPRINGNGGRDHWTYCYSMFMAGGGIRGGSVYGASDAQAAYVKDYPVSPADICATIYECLGIDPDMPVQERSGRPLPVAQGGRALHELLV
jgi:uncharacterized protein (DUF1501 family)